MTNTALSILKNGRSKESDKKMISIKEILKLIDKNKALTNPPNDFVVSDGGSTTNGSAASSGKYTKFADLEYNITLEQSTHRNDGAFDQITRQIKLLTLP